MPNVQSWLNWIAEYKILQDKLDEGGVSLSPLDMQRLMFLRNLLEAGMGTKTILSEDNRRRDLRTPCEFDVKVSKNSSTIDGKAYNISFSGGFVTTVPLLSADDRVSIEFAGLKGEKIIRNGVVRRVSDREMVSGSVRTPPGAGLEFDNVPFKKDDPFRDLFYKIVEERILKRI